MASFKGCIPVMSKQLLILFFALVCALSLQAQDDNDYTSDTTDEVKIFHEQTGTDIYQVEDETADTSLVARSISLEEDQIINLRNKKKYYYLKNIDSLLKASQETKVPVGRTIKTGSFMSRLLSGPVIKIILWMLALTFVGIIVYQLLKSRGLFQRASSSKVSEQSVEEEELSLHNDFDQLVQQALRSGDYRMAVRYLFLKTLQQLRNKNQINYEPDKTNSRYVYEIPVNWRNDFSQLIFQYEYVWYGHFDLNEEQFEQVQKGFHSFLQKV